MPGPYNGSYISPESRVDQARLSHDAKYGVADPARPTAQPAQPSADQGASPGPDGKAPDGTTQPAPSRSGVPADGEVTITANGKRVSGWTDVEIGGGLDQAPAYFSISMTERYPGELQAVILNPGDACTINIGADLVLTGYINRTPRSLSPRGHVIRVEGRSRCQDLLDCSAVCGSMSIVNQPVGDVANLLVKPFAGPIGVLLPDGGGSGKPYNISITLGETPWEIIGQIASYEGLLVHDDAHGNLVLCKVGTTKMASGFGEGLNVQTAATSNADEMLFSKYIPVLMAQDTLAMIGPGGNDAGAPVMDPLVKRYRPLIVVSDQMVQGAFLAQQRAVWEATRRRGRASSVTLTCDSWRDTAGALWTHNKLAPLRLPTLHLDGVQWLVATWLFKRTEQGGTTADIMLMPPEAFSVMPSALTGTNYLIAQANKEAEQRAAGVGTASPGGAPITAPNAQAASSGLAGFGHGI